MSGLDCNPGRYSFSQLKANQFRSEEDYAAEVRQTTLSEFFTLLEQEDPVTNNCNFLDLPLPFHQAEDPIVKWVSMSHL